MITDAGTDYPSLLGKVIVRIRCTQGHSSAADLAQRDPALRIRIGQTPVPAGEIPVILLHATLWAKVESIRNLGGGLQRYKRR